MNKPYNFFRKLVNSTPIMTLFGVLLGGILTGLYSYKTQQLLIEHQENIFKDSYAIEKNKELRKDLNDFIDYLSFVILPENDELKYRETLRKMQATSLKISLLEDLNIGINCYSLTDEIRIAFDGGKLTKNKGNEIIKKWIISVKTEMKVGDYTIDDRQLEKDLIQMFLNTKLCK